MKVFDYYMERMGFVAMGVQRSRWFRLFVFQKYVFVVLGKDQILMRVGQGLFQVGVVELGEGDFFQR